jgi:hypothetical protein
MTILSRDKMDAKTKKQAKDLADEIIKEVGPAIRDYV